MIKSKEVIEVDYLYDSFEERESHVEEMIRDGWGASGQIQVRLDTYYQDGKKEWKPIGRFFKRLV